MPMPIRRREWRIDSESVLHSLFSGWYSSLESPGCPGLLPRSDRWRSDSRFGNDQTRSALRRIVLPENFRLCYLPDTRHHPLYNSLIGNSLSVLANVGLAFDTTRQSTHCEGGGPEICRVYKLKSDRQRLIPGGPHGDHLRADALLLGSVPRRDPDGCGTLFCRPVWS